MSALNMVGLVAIVVLGVSGWFAGPALLDMAQTFNLTVYIVMSILALSLALVWGFGGIICFGQAAFFGLGAYTYAIAMINMGESTVPVLLAMALPAAFAALLGYFIFYGRLSDVYLGVITLVVTLIFFKLIGSTAGSEYRIGAALLGGYNGIPAIPPINWPGDASRPLDIPGVFRLALALLVLTYLGLRALLHSHFGRVIVAIRENELRAELLGYDVRLHKLAVFTLGAAIAGLAGCLYATWGGYVSPDVFSLQMAAQILMWVIVGGIGTLIGPIIGCFALQILATELGAQQLLNTYLIFGMILLAFVLAVPGGIVSVIRGLLEHVPARAGARSATTGNLERLDQKG
jgi:ABC-type branched-subunit amino acid transport system permease subunit